METVGELRKALEGLPDDMPLIGEAAQGQEEILYACVCTHLYDGMHHQESDKSDYLERGKNFSPDRWAPLEKPSFKIVLRY